MNRGIHPKPIFFLAANIIKARQAEFKMIEGRKAKRAQERAGRR